MLNFFDTLIGYIELFINFIVNFFQMLGNLIVIVISAMSVPTEVILFAPAIVGACVTTVVGVSIVKLLLWGSNK